MWNDILSTLYPSSEPPVVPIHPHVTTWVTEWDGNDILSNSKLSSWIEPPVVSIDPHGTTWVTELDGNDILSTSILFSSTEPTRSVVPLCMGREIVSFILTI